MEPSTQLFQFTPETKTCSLCGASRNEDGCCSFVGCKDPLLDNRIEAQKRRIDALEALWSAWKKVHESGTGYDPAFADAVKTLEGLERVR